MAANPELKQKVEELLGSNQVFLFMKGTPEMPRCGFSMRVVGVLEQLGVEYGAVDVLPLLDPLREVLGQAAPQPDPLPHLVAPGRLDRAPLEDLEGQAAADGGAGCGSGA